MRLLASDPWTTWSFPPLVVAVAGLGVAFYLQGWLRLRRRGRPDLASWDRLALFAAGISVVTLAIVSPVDAVGEGYLQSMHMLQHVLVADLGIVLIILSVRGPLTVFLLPRDLLAPLARQAWLRRAVAWLLRPRNAIALWLAALLAWHVPALYETALQNRAVHNLQHFSFILAGALLWIVLLDPTRHRRLSLAERVGVAAVVFAAGQLLAYALIFGYRPYYGTYVEQETRLLGLSPLTDQKLSGVVMMVEQVMTVGVFLFWALLIARRPAATARSTALRRT